jgi:putative ABC transport system permease protein
MRTFARLKPGVSIAQAKEEMEPLFEHTLNAIWQPDARKDVHLSIRSMRDRETEDVQSAAWNTALLCTSGPVDCLRECG